MAFECHEDAWNTATIRNFQIRVPSVRHPSTPLTPCADATMIDAMEQPTPSPAPSSAPSPSASSAALLRYYCGINQLHKCQVTVGVDSSVKVVFQNCKISSNFLVYKAERKQDYSSIILANMMMTLEGEKL